MPVLWILANAPVSLDPSCLCYLALSTPRLPRFPLWSLQGCSPASCPLSYHPWCAYVLVHWQGTIDVAGCGSLVHLMANGSWPGIYFIIVVPTFYIHVLSPKCRIHSLNDTQSWTLNYRDVVWCIEHASKRQGHDVALLCFAGMPVRRNTFFWFTTLLVLWVDTLGRLHVLQWNYMWDSTHSH